MATAAQMRTPTHLWIVGVLSLLWNCFGSYDYLMTRMRNMDYLAGMTPPGIDVDTMLAYLDGMPLYAQIGWGLGVCVVREPQGITALLSSGTFGHGGAFGTQAWVDSKLRRIYILMVQRSNFPNSDDSPVRLAFQKAAAPATKSGGH